MTKKLIAALVFLSSITFFCPDLLALSIPKTQNLAFSEKKLFNGPDKDNAKAKLLIYDNGADSWYGFFTSRLRKTSSPFLRYECSYSGEDFLSLIVIREYNRRHVLQSEQFHDGKKIEYYASGRKKTEALPQPDNAGAVFCRYLDENWNNTGVGRIQEKTLAAPDQSGIKAYKFTYHTKLETKKVLVSSGFFGRKYYVTRTYSVATDIVKRAYAYSDSNFKVLLYTCDYDIEGRLMKRIDNKGNYITYTYEGKTGNISSTSEYNKSGKLLKKTEYDAIGRMKRELISAATDTAFTYHDSTARCKTKVLKHLNVTGLIETYTYYGNEANRKESIKLNIADQSGNVYCHYMDTEANLMDVSQLVRANEDGEVAFEYTYYEGTGKIRYKNSFSDVERKIKCTRYEYDVNGSLIKTLKYGSQMVEVADDVHYFDISKSGYATWASWDGVSGSVFLYDGSSVRQIVDSISSYVSPKVNSSGYLTWSDYDGALWDIFLYDGFSVEQIYNKYNESDSSPKINENGWVTWQRDLKGYNYGSAEREVFLYDGFTDRQLTNNSYCDYNSQISDSGYVAWAENAPWESGYYAPQIFFYNGTSVVNLSRKLSFQNSYAMGFAMNSLGHVAFSACTDYGSKPNDITRHELNLYDGVTTRLITSGLGHVIGAIKINSNNQIVWEESDQSSAGNGIYQIFYYDGISVTQLKNNNNERTGFDMNSKGEVVWTENCYDSGESMLFFYDGHSVKMLDKRSPDGPIVPIMSNGPGGDMIYKYCPTSFYAPRISDDGQIFWREEKTGENTSKLFTLKPNGIREMNTYYKSGRKESLTLFVPDGAGNVYCRYLDEDRNGQGYGRVAVTQLAKPNESGEIAFEYEYYDGTDKVKSKHSFKDADRTQGHAAYEFNVNGDLTSVSVGEQEISASEKDGKVAILHIPPGNPEKARIIYVATESLTAHLGHGDILVPDYSGEKYSYNPTTGKLVTYYSDSGSVKQEINKDGSRHEYEYFGDGSTKYKEWFYGDDGKIQSVIQYWENGSAVHYKWKIKGTGDIVYEEYDADGMLIKKMLDDGTVWTFEAGIISTPQYIATNIHNPYFLNGKVAWWQHENEMLAQSGIYAPTNVYYYDSLQATQLSDSKTFFTGGAYGGVQFASDPVIFGENSEYVAWRYYEYGTIWGPNPWQQFSGCINSQIHVYDGAGVTQITNDDYNKEFLVGAGNYLAWSSNRACSYDRSFDENGDIFLYDGNNVKNLSNGMSKYVFQDDVDDTGNVAWEGFDGNDQEIYLYDGHEVKQITNNDYQDWNPQIDNGQIVWSTNYGRTQPDDPRGAGYCTESNVTSLMLYNGQTTQRIIDIPDESLPFPGENLSYVFNDGQIIWNAYDGHDQEIYFYDGSKITQITDNDFNDYVSPSSLENGKFVWTGTWSGPGYGWSSVYYYDGSSVQELTEGGSTIYNAKHYFEPKIDNGMAMWTCRNFSIQPIEDKIYTMDLSKPGWKRQNNIDQETLARMAIESQLAQNRNNTGDFTYSSQMADSPESPKTPISQ